MTADKTAASRTESKARTRARILEATLQTLIDEGSAGFSMNKVAKRAGIAQPSFYVHFENTDQLFAALADNVADRFIRPLQHSLESVVQTLPPGELRPMVARLFGVGFDIIRSQQSLCQMVWSERDLPNSPLGAHLRKFYRDTKKSWSETLLRIGLIPAGPDTEMRLVLFMDGVFALFETYAKGMLSGLYPTPNIVEALTDYVLNFWAAYLGMSTEAATS